MLKEESEKMENYTQNETNNETDDNKKKEKANCRVLSSRISSRVVLLKSNDISGEYVTSVFRVEE
jgi:hypothetical protein